MVRRVALLVVAVLLGAGVSASADPHGGDLRLDVVSGPAQYVSGGAARIRVTLPPWAPLAATVTVNGNDVTSAFTPDDQVPHALEGVVRDLPVGVSKVEARSRRWDRAEVRLVNHPITGPMFSGPQQPDFFCSTPAHL